MRILREPAMDDEDDYVELRKFRSWRRYRHNGQSE